MLLNIKHVFIKSWETHHSFNIFLWLIDIRMNMHMRQNIQQIDIVKYVIFTSVHDHSIVLSKLILILVTVCMLVTALN